MGRITTAAIITLALAGATVQSFAGDLPKTDPAASQPKAGEPIEQLLADASAPAAPDAGPAADAPPPMGQMPPPPPGMGPGPHGMEGMGMPPHPGMPGPFMEHMRHMAATWGLFFNQPDKKLSTGDVQTLAQAILLIHGNHSWKVADVAPAADGAITFAYTTEDGAVIARFSVDPHSGRLNRIG
ncbi:hypothetical protein [Acidisoma sp. 7E03]